MGPSSPQGEANVFSTVVSSTWASSWQTQKKHIQSPSLFCGSLLCDTIVVLSEKSLRNTSNYCSSVCTALHIPHGRSIVRSTCCSRLSKVVVQITEAVKAARLLAKAADYLCFRSTCIHPQHVGQATVCRKQSRCAELTS